MIIFDTDRCFWRQKINYDLLSIDDFNNYVETFYQFFSSEWYWPTKRQTIKIDCNIISKRFRLILTDSSSTRLISQYSIYKNGNLKMGECLFHLLNYSYGKKYLINDWTLIPNEIDRDGAVSLKHMFNVFSRETLVKDKDLWNRLFFITDRYIEEFTNQTPHISQGYVYFFGFASESIPDDVPLKVQSW